MSKKQELLDKHIIKNTIYLPGSTYCMFDLWVDIAISLNKRFNFDPVYFFYWNDEKFKENHLKLNDVGFNVFFQNHMDAWKGKNYYRAKKTNVLDQDKLDFFAPFELKALKMMDRIDPLGERFPFTHRQYFFRDLLLHWLDIVDELLIKVVISPSIPHQVYDYVLYAVCQYKEIEFITFQHTPFIDASLIIGNIDGLPSCYDYELGSSAEVKQYGFIDEYCERVAGDKKLFKVDYMEAQKEKELESTLYGFIKKTCNKFIVERRLLNFMKKVYSRVWVEREYNLIPKFIIGFFVRLFGSKWSYWVEKGKMPDDSNYSRIALLSLQLKMKQYVKKTRNQYVKSSDKQPILDDYVLFALHYQPEETTSPTGGVYVDQLLAIEMLDRFLPSGITIFVKEHTSQFYTVLEASQGRTDVFYQRLESFSDRVVTVDHNINSFDLIDDSICVVTVSGTIGFESILRGRPVLTFGRTWYEYMFGVNRVRNYEDLESAWQFIQSEDLSDIRKSASEYLKFLSRDMVLAIHCGSYLKRSSRSYQESTKNITQGIQRYLNSE